MKCNSSYFLNWWTLWWQNSTFQWWTPRTLTQVSTNFTVAVKKPAPSASIFFFPSNANSSSLSLEALNMPFILCMLKIQKAVSTRQFSFMVSSAQFSLEALLSSVPANSTIFFSSPLPGFSPFFGVDAYWLIDWPFSFISSLSLCPKSDRFLCLVL